MESSPEEPQDETTLAIVGPGAVGGLLAVLLERSGVDVVVVARPESARAIQRDGLTLRSEMFGDSTSRVRATTEIPAGSRVLLATKAYATAEVIPAIARAQPSEVISLLNGIEHMDVLRSQLPGFPTAGCTIAVEATRQTPTQIEHRSPFLRVVAPAKARDFDIVAALRRAGVDVAIGGDEREVLWAKLRFLAPMALLTATWREPLGAALRHDPGLTTDLVAEIAQVASADGLDTSPEQLAGILADFPAGMRSSLQVDVQAGNANELDAIGGAIIRRGAVHGISVPTLERVVAQLARS